MWATHSGELNALHSGRGVQPLNLPMHLYVFYLWVNMKVNMIPRRQEMFYSSLFYFEEAMKAVNSVRD